MALQRYEVKNPVGILKDPEASNLPLAAWNDGRNIRFKNGKVEKTMGHQEVFGASPANPLFAMPYLSANTPYWFVANSTSIQRTEGGVYLDVSRTVGGAYTMSPSEHFWTGGFLSGVAVMNNIADVPQVMQPNDTDFKDLPNWPSNYRCKVLRPFKNYLIALNIEKDDVWIPTLVKWSSPADPGEVPFTWDPTDYTNDAGESPLADTPGAIVDGQKLRDSFIIYKEDSVYSMRYIGGIYVWQFQQLFNDVGVLAPHCVAEFDGKHFVVGLGDVYVHNGVQKNSVISGKMKDYLYNTLRGISNSKVFVVPDYNSSEMWICFTSAEASNGQADRAVIWNWNENTWTIRDLPNVAYGTYGVIDPQDPNYWDADSQAWNQDTTVWGDGGYNPSKTRILLVDNTNSKTYMVGDSSTFNGSTFISRFQRDNIYGDDDVLIKHITSVTPHFSGEGTAKIWVGCNMVQDAPVEWFGPYTYEIAHDFKIDCRVSGRYIGVRFEVSTPGDWKFSGYTLEFTPTIGRR